MKMVGEASFSQMGKATKAPKYVKVRNISASCRECGYETLLSISIVRNIQGGKDGWKCSHCREKDKKEMQQTLINMTKRKGLI